jgi:hypothetical protein
MRSLPIMVLVMWLSVAGAASAAQPLVSMSQSPAADGGTAALSLFPATLFTRTELFFGSLKPNGSLVSEEAFLGFLDAEITPRFPDGLTLLTGLGQFLNTKGVIIQEPSRLLILLYPVEEWQDSSEKIEQIREQYKQMFEQESVLRALLRAGRVLTRGRHHRFIATHQGTAAEVGNTHDSGAADTLSARGAWVSLQVLPYPGMRCDRIGV